MKSLELYIHIPFCVRKCAYCDFLSAPAGRKQQEKYFHALEQEIQHFPSNLSGHIDTGRLIFDKEDYIVTSVFFGGGTPSIVPGEWIIRLLDLMRMQFHFDRNAEISIECNPGTADREKLRTYRSAGVNRLSLGLQSADNRELELLGRIHTWEDFLRTFATAEEAGFSNINVDLMSALPGQTAASWETTLRKVLELRPQHISAYSLIIEEGTPFFDVYGEDARVREAGEIPRLLPSEDEEREMYCMTEALLSGAGMHRYEISNYALPGYECRHNIGYWDGTEYVGFGLGASSLLEMSEKKKGDENKKIRVRMKNTDEMQTYLMHAGDSDGCIYKDCDMLSYQDQMEEFMFLGLRMMRGISETDFQKRFGRTIDEVYGGVIRRHVNQGLLQRKGGRISLTDKGTDLSNMVMADFLF